VIKGFKKNPSGFEASEKRSTWWVKIPPGGYIRVNAAVR